LINISPQVSPVEVAHLEPGARDDVPAAPAHPRIGEK
jgi:hypothetical protein